MEEMVAEEGVEEEVGAAVVVVEEGEGGDIDYNSYWCLVFY